MAMVDTYIHTIVEMVQLQKPYFGLCGYSDPMGNLNLQPESRRADIQQLHAQPKPQIRSPSGVQDLWGGGGRRVVVSVVGASQDFRV